MFTLFISVDLYHDHVVVELSVSKEELQFDIVKEALEDGIHQSKQNKKYHHHVQKDRPEIKQLDDMIQDQEKLIIKLQKEVIELRNQPHEQPQHQPLQHP